MGRRKKVVEEVAVENLVTEESVTKDVEAVTEASHGLQLFMEYVDRVSETTGKTKVDVAKAFVAKAVAYKYGVTLEEYNNYVNLLVKSAPALVKGSLIVE